MRRYEHGGDIYTNKNILLDFSVNTNPLGMSEAIENALVRHMGEFSLYPDPSCGELRTALARFHGVGEESILCGNGAADMIFRICACLKPKLALTLAPSFSEYERPVKLFGGSVTEFGLCEKNGFALDDGIIERITPDVEAAFLCSPNNPTGRLADAALISRIAARCRDTGTVLVLDECFIGFTRGESLIPKLGEHKNLLVLRAFTKLYSMAGLRLGYIVGDEALVSRVAEFGAHWSVSAPAQAAGVAALALEPQWTQKTLAFVERERARVANELSNMGLCPFASDANFMLIKSERPLFASLLAKGLLVRDCSNFTGLDESYIRIGLKTEEKNDALLRAISEVING